MDLRTEQDHIDLVFGFRYSKWIHMPDGSETQLEFKLDPTGIQILYNSIKI